MSNATRCLFAGFPNFLETSYSSVTLAGAAEASMPISRLRTPALYEKARLVATEEWVISWRYGGDQREISYVGLYDHNFPEDATIQIFLYERTDFVYGVTEPIYFSAELPALEAWDTDFASSEGVDWGSFEWGGITPAERVLGLPRHFMHPILEDGTDGTKVPRHLFVGGGVIVVRGLSTAVNSYAQAGYLETSKLWQPDRNFDIEWSMGWEQASTNRTRGKNGNTFARNYPRLRKLTMNFSRLNRTELLDFLFAWSYQRGPHHPLMVMPEPGFPQFWWAQAGIWEMDPINVQRLASMSDLWEGSVTLTEWKGPT